jgi:hypothetical protein
MAIIRIKNLACNNLRQTLSMAASGSGGNNLVVPFRVSGTPTSYPVSTITTSSDLIYPCTIWVTPASGATVNVHTSLDGYTSVQWTPGAVAVFTSQVYNTCPGSITFTLVSGASAIVGVT